MQQNKDLLSDYERSTAIGDSNTSRFNKSNKRNKRGNVKGTEQVTVEQGISDAVI